MDIKPKHCTKISNFAPFEECLNFNSLLHLKEKNFILLRQNFASKIYINFAMYALSEKILDGELVNWIETSDMCRSLGGFLPYFTSKEDLDELIALSNLRKGIPPIEAIFIGLNRKNEQVRPFFDTVVSHEKCYTPT